jgi:hypothetical protein
MSTESTDFIRDRIKHLEHSFGFRPDAVKSGAYVFRNDRRLKKSESDPGTLMAAGEYASLVNIASRFGDGDAQRLERVFLRRVVESRPACTDQRQLISDALRSVANISDAIDGRKIIGPSGKKTVVPAMCAALAGMAMRMAENHSGIKEDVGGVVRMVSA